ncbi:MAG: hypothetical protein R3B70_49320 [Polyangiaceae bacterium]
MSHADSPLPTRRTTAILRALALTAAAAALPACGGGTGSVSFDTWGEEYIEEEIPTSEFEDGWQVKYDTFLVNIGHVKVADSDGTLGAEMPGTTLFNHRLAGTKPVFKATDLAEGPWKSVSFEVPKITADTELSTGVTQAEKDAMLAAGAAIHVRGTATKGSVTKTFDWFFAKGTVFDDCKGERDGKEVSGAIVTSGGTDQIQLTIHGDHLFYDDLQSENAVLRFDPIAAADADDNGEVTLQELSQIKLVTLDAGPYGTGSADGIDDLAAFVTALSQTVGHFRGEGECFGRTID